MKRITWIAAGLALAACGDKDGTDTGGNVGGADGDGGESCEVSVDSTFPEADASDHYYLAAVEFELSDPDSTATLTVTDASGAEVAGSVTTNDDGDVLYFEADGGFDPSSTYTATASICGGELNPSISFSTSELGTARDCDLTGKSYVVDLNNARFVEPEGVADLLLSQLENNILLGVSGYADSDYLDIVGAISVDGGTEQDFCTESIDFSGVDFSMDPTFNAGPADTTFSVAGYDIVINQLQISGTFAPDCSYFGGGVLAGELDARLLAPLLLELLDTDDPDYICELLVGFGVNCGACSSDGEEYCLTILADSLVATELGTEIECVDESDCHAQCAESTCEDTSLGECE